MVIDILWKCLLNDSIAFLAMFCFTLHVDVHIGQKATVYRENVWVCVSLCEFNTKQICHKICNLIFHLMFECRFCCYSFFFSFIFDVFVLNIAIIIISSNINWVTNSAFMCRYVYPSSPYVSVCASSLA